MHRCITRIKEKVGFYWVFGLLAKRVESKMKYKEFQQLIDYGRKKNLLVMPNSKFVRSKSNYVWGNIFACFCLALFVSCNKSILHFRLAILIWYSYLNFQWRSMVLILFFFSDHLIDASCYFSQQFQGEYVMQNSANVGAGIQYSPLTISPNSISIWGNCHKRHDNNVILMFKFK